MRYWLIILAFLPLSGFGQWIVYADIDWDSVTPGYLTTQMVDTAFNDFTSLGTVNFDDSTKVMPENSTFGTQYLRAYAQPQSGCCDECAGGSKPGIYVIANMDDSVKYDIYFTGLIQFSDGFNGGEAGGKIFTTITSKYNTDTTIWDVLYEVETGDSLTYWYYYDYNRALSQYGATDYSIYKFHPGQVYNWTIRVDAGTIDNSDGSMALYVDGICVDVSTGHQFRSSADGLDAYASFGFITYNFFFGGGGCSPNYATWINYGRSKLWWPTPSAYSDGTFRANGTASQVGDTIPLPLDFKCNDWTYCDDFYNGGLLECADTWTVDGRTDGVCSPTQIKTATYRGIYSISDFIKRGLSLNPSYRGVNYE